MIELQVVAVFVAATTLTLIVVFRIRDSQTRTVIRFEVVKSPLERPKLVFQVVNRSKMTIHLDGRVNLIDKNEMQALVRIDRENDTGLTQQGSFKTYVIELARVRMKLHQRGYRDETTASLYFAVYDGTGKVHELPVVVQNLKDSNNTTVISLPFPWYKRWHRRIRRRCR